MCHRVRECVFVCVFLSYAYLSTYRCVDVLLMEVVIHSVRQASIRACAFARAHTHTHKSWYQQTATQAERLNLSTFGSADTDNFPCRSAHGALGLGLHLFALGN